LQLTGIKQEDLWKAPTFDQICSKLTEVLGDATFVAHNARFDKGFLKAEFARLETAFSPKTICTVQLSKKVFTSERYHNLDELIRRLNVDCTNRHRAYDDAYVLYEFFQYIEKKFTPEECENLLKQVLKDESITPPKKKKLQSRLNRPHRKTKSQPSLNFEPTPLPHWPFQGILSIKEKLDDTDQEEVIFIDQWCLIAKGTVSEFGFHLEKIPEKIFDENQYNTIQKYLSKRSHRAQVKVLDHQTFQNILETHP
jgi:hypothetical protein